MIGLLVYEILTARNKASCEKADDAFVPIIVDLEAAVRSRMSNNVYLSPALVRPVSGSFDTVTPVSKLNGNAS
jgi:hypothetical protein